MTDTDTDTDKEIEGILIPEDMFVRWDSKIKLAESCEFQLYSVGERLIAKAYSIAMDDNHPSSADMTKFLLSKILKSTKQPVDRRHPKDVEDGDAGGFPNIYTNLIENFNKANNPELIEGECEEVGNEPE